jgi:hypothetical protein
MEEPMAHYFRAQEKNITLEEMFDFNSADGGDGYTEGLCVTDEIDSRFGGALDALDDDDEIVILNGIVLAEIYDGYRIRPTAEVARFTIAEWHAMCESGEAWEYETY